MLVFVAIFLFFVAALDLSDHFSLFACHVQLIKRVLPLVVHLNSRG